MGWSDDDDEEDILLDLDSVDASRPRPNRAAREVGTVADKLLDDEAEADADEVDSDSHAEEDDEERKSAVTVEEREETGNKAQTALLYMVNQMAKEVEQETGMQCSKQVTTHTAATHPHSNACCTAPQSVLARLAADRCGTAWCMWCAGAESLA